MRHNPLSGEAEEALSDGHAAATSKETLPTDGAGSPIPFEEGKF